MGLLRDIYDIIASQEQAKSVVDKAVLEFLRGGLFQRSPTREERKLKLKGLVSQLADSKFSQSFASPLEFLGVLVGTTVECTYAAGRGCVFDNLYLPGHLIYFPVATREPKLGKFTAEGGKVQLCALKYEDSSDYVFYAIALPDNCHINAAQIRHKLSDLAMTNPLAGERDSLLDWLKGGGAEVTALLGIGRNTETNTFRYMTLHVSMWGQSRQLPLNFTDPSTKAAAKQTLLDLLDSSVI